jgi:hypothetical protein
MFQAPISILPQDRNVGPKAFSANFLTGRIYLVKCRGVNEGHNATGRSTVTFWPLFEDYRN